MKWNRRSLAVVVIAGGLFASVLVFLVLAYDGRGETLTDEALERARAKWAAAAILNYDLRLTTKTTGSEKQTYTTIVRDGRARELRLNGKPSTSHQVNDYTVEGLFSTLARELELSSNSANGFGASSGTNLLRVTFDEQAGFVRRYLRSIGGTGRTTEIRVVRFEIKNDKADSSRTGESQ